MFSSPGSYIMASADFIPAGRTSRIVKGSTELQIQTEYACRPNPRMTTSVISKGQVIHKIQQDLAAPISSIEEKAKAEDMLRRQHMGVLQVVRNKDFCGGLAVKSNSDNHAPSPPLLERLAGIKGVEKVYRVDNNGCFDTPNISSEFKKQFSGVFKRLHEALSIFGYLPGGRREEGVCEIESNRLYLVSSGYDCYFLLTRPVSRDTSLDEEIRTVLKK